MVRPSSLQIYVPRELCERVRATASIHGMSVSQWVGQLVSRGCDDEDLGGKGGAAIERIARQSLFVMIAYPNKGHIYGILFDAVAATLKTIAADQTSRR